MFLVLPDVPPPAALARHLAGVGTTVVRHPSGRPWIAASGTDFTDVSTVGSTSTVRVGTGPGAHTISRDPAVVRVTGTLSTAQHVFWTTVDGVVVASGSASLLKELTGASLDVRRVAVALCGNPPAALRLEPFWTGISTVPPGATLVIGQVGKPAVEAAEPVAAVESRDAADAAVRVAHALDAAVAARVKEHAVLGCDLSGGIDSTTLAFLLDHQGADVRYTRASTLDAANDDARYAAAAAALLRGPLAELASLTGSMTAFAADLGFSSCADGPPVWASNAAYVIAALRETGAAGATAHLNGLGGDELFSVLPAAVLEGAHGRPVQYLRAVHRMRTLQRWSASATVRALARRRSFTTELRRQARSAADHAHGSDPTELFAWSPGFAPHAALTAEARDLVLSAVEGVGPHDALGTTVAQTQVLESIVFQGQLGRNVNECLESTGVRWESPFLDEDLVRLVLGIHPELRAADGSHKGLLASAVRGRVPDWVFERGAKGEYSYDLVQEFYTRRDDLGAYLADGWLAAEGLVSRDAVVRLVGAPLVEATQLFEIEELVAVERWIREVV